MTAQLIEVPRGQVAAVVTYLEMRGRPASGAVPESPLRLERWRAVDPDRYRSLFRKVGARWLWFSRLTMTDAELGAIVQHPSVELYEVTAVEPVVGMLELDFREAGQCELAFIGLVPELAGQGHGRWLLAEALRLAWRDGVERVHVHTCTLDHPAALPNYEKRGFREFKQIGLVKGDLPRIHAAQAVLSGSRAAALSPQSTCTDASVNSVPARLKPAK
mgnify:CR=1 FL=1